MSKTITLRLDEDTYNIFKKAADGNRRTISNFVEFVTLNYVLGDNMVDDAEMHDILRHEKDLRSGLGDIKKGRYEFVD